MRPLANPSTHDGSASPLARRAPPRYDEHRAVKIVVDLHEAESRLSRLIEHARSGDEVIIAKNGESIARLVPIARAAKRRPMGAYAGHIRIPDDFNAPVQDEFAGAGGTRK
jgi:prevent-host-death family protein